MSKPDEPRYTLAEAKKILDRRECMFFGHNLREIKQFGGEVVIIYCDRCGDRWVKDNA